MLSEGKVVRVFSLLQPLGRLSGNRATPKHFRRNGTARYGQAFSACEMEGQFRQISVRRSTESSHDCLETEAELVDLCEI